MKEAINLFFFGEEQISAHDALWSYGMYVAWAMIISVVALQVYL